MLGLFTRKKNRHLCCGDVVAVHSLKEILATLDEQGTCEGLPFMAEMAPYCGKEFRVARRVEHVFLDHLSYVTRLENTVILEGLRCGGDCHGGCQMGCHLLWKESWLGPAGSAVQAPPTGDDLQAALRRLPAEKEGQLFCQATQLQQITTRLPWWDVRQYFRGLAAGNLSPRELLRMGLLLVVNQVRWRIGKPPHGMLAGPLDKTVSESLHLQPGEWVEVKTREEIQATLDKHGKTRGLAFVPEMALYCGRRYQVARRVERMIQEGTGEMRSLKDTVALEAVTCMGLAQRRCPRGCFHLWRECWLKRVPAPTTTPPATTFPSLPIVYLEPAELAT